MSSEKQVPSRKGASGVVFVGCLMLGLAVGLLIEDVAVGVLGGLGGLGIGFIAMGIVRYSAGEW